MQFKKKTHHREYHVKIDKIYTILENNKIIQIAKNVKEQILEDSRDTFIYLL